MRSLGKIATIFLFLFISPFLFGRAGGQESDERQKLTDQQKLLINRIEQLKGEQDFLLFQKTMYASDSKYLIINMMSKTGQLKYKNRLLKDFHFLPASNNTARLNQGTLTVTKKIEGKKGRNLLIFGNSFILQAKGRPAVQRTDVPRITVGKKDFLSIFYALEEGSMAYIFP